MKEYLLYMSLRASTRGEARITLLLCRVLNSKVGLTLCYAVRRSLCVPLDEKQHFSPITTMHVYSVQKNIPSDSAALWAVDLEKTKELSSETVFLTNAYVSAAVLLCVLLCPNAPRFPGAVL